MTNIEDWFRGLRGRRRCARLRRLAAAMLAGCAVWCALQCIMGAIRTRPVLVSTRALDAGEPLAATDVIVTRIPDHQALGDALDDPVQVEERFASIPIGDGSIVLASMLSTIPAVPTGYTVVDIRLGDLQHAFDPGTRVELASAVGCPIADNGANATLCTVSTDAIVMGTPDSDGMAPMALPARDALKALDLQSQAPILALRAPPRDG